MKRKYLLLIALLLIIISALTLVACTKRESSDKNSSTDSSTLDHQHYYNREVPTSTYLKSAATCTMPAIYYYSCSCGRKGPNYFVYGSTLAHNFSRRDTSERYLKRKGNCTSPDIYYYSCRNCGQQGSETDTFEDYSNYNGAHNYCQNKESKYLVSSATCTSPAVYYWSCNYCGEADYGSTFEDYDSYTGHNFSEQKIEDRYLATRGTCTESALYYYSCSQCGAAGENTFEDLSNYIGYHTNEQNPSEIYLASDATCNEPAKYYYSCSRCGVASTDIFEYDNGYRASHDFSEQNTDSIYLADPGTCVSPATYYYSCSHCGEINYDNTFEDYSNYAGGHDFSYAYLDERYLASAGGCNTHPTYYYACSRCGASGSDTFVDYDSYGSHDFCAQNIDDIHMASEATCTSRATYYYSCKYCGQLSDDTFAYGEFGEHKYEWQCDKQTHRLVATCEHSLPVKNEGNHQVDSEGICEICAYSRGIRIPLYLDGTLLDGNDADFVYAKKEDNFVLNIYRQLYWTNDINSNPLSINTNNYNARFYIDKWYFDSACTQKVPEDYAYTKKINLYAKSVYVYPYCYQYSVSDGKATLTKYSRTTDTVIVVPSYIDGYPVVGLVSELFKGKSDAIKIIIMNGVETIGSYCFSGCSNLSLVELPNSITSIGYEAFRGCWKLASVTIPENVTNISSYAFYGCGLKIINWNAINCTNASNVFDVSNEVSINIGPKVQSLPSNAFKGCLQVKQIIISNGVKTIGQTIFENSSYHSCSSCSGSGYRESCRKCGSSNVFISIGASGSYLSCNKCGNVSLASKCSWCDGKGSILSVESGEETTIYYEGTKDEWNQIAISNNKQLNEAKLCFYSENKPVDSGNYWHYDDSGKPIIWIKDEE